MMNDDDAKTYTQYKFEFESFITGHHVYKDIWTPVIGEELQCYMEDDNPHDRYAIKLVNKNNAIVGHVPRDLCKSCRYALYSGGKITAVVTGRRENRRSNGLEVPCSYKLKGTKDVLLKVETIINISKELLKSEILCFYFPFVVGVSISKFALSASPWA